MSDAPIRVLSVVNSLAFGGAEKHAVALLNHLDAQRFQLSLVYLKPQETLLPQLNRERLQGILSLNVSRKLDWQAVKTLARFIDQHSIDVILCTMEYAALFALLAAQLASRRPKLVEVFHTTLFRTLKEKAQMMLYRQIFRRFDLLVYVSHHQRAYWRAKGIRAKKDAVIHNGIDPSYFRDTFTPQEKEAIRSRAGFGSDDYVVAICAALRPEKAHGDFLQALANLRSQGLPVKGLLIGDGSERVNIEHTIERLGLRGAVFITGFQSDVRPFVASSDVVVLASHTIETFSVAALEAMALGKPLLLSRIGGAAEQVTDNVNGFLFEPGDIDGLTTHLITLSDAAQRVTMGRAAVDRVRQHFTETRMVAAFSEQLAALGCNRSSFAETA